MALTPTPFPSITRLYFTQRLTAIVYKPHTRPRTLPVHHHHHSLLHSSELDHQHVISRCYLLVFIALVHCIVLCH